MSFEPPPSVAAEFARMSAARAAAARAGIPWCETHEVAYEEDGIDFVCPRCEAEMPPVPQPEALFGVAEDPQTGYLKIRVPDVAPPAPTLGIADGPFADEMTLAEARHILAELAEDGEICPCCGLRAQIYKRPINGTMARSLIAMHRAWGHEWGDLPSLRREAQLHHSNQEGMLAWFGLIEEEAVRRPDGGRAGFWRVTELGERWVKSETTVPKYARTYGGRVLNLLGPDVTISDVLPDHFDLRAVMAGTVDE